MKHIHLDKVKQEKIDCQKKLNVLAKDMVTTNVILTLQLLSTDNQVGITHRDLVNDLSEEIKQLLLYPKS